MKEFGHGVTKSKGASEVISAILKTVDDAAAAGRNIEIVGIERALETRVGGVSVAGIVNGSGEVVAGRRYDFEAIVDGKLIKYEVKSYDRWSIENLLPGSLSGVVRKSGERAGQLRADLIHVINSVVDATGNLNVDNVDVRWVFDGRAAHHGYSAERMADIVIRKFEDDGVIDEFATAMKHPYFKARFPGAAGADLEGIKDFEEFVAGPEGLRSILERMFVVDARP